MIGRLPKLSNGFPNDTKSISELIKETKDILATNMELGWDLVQSYIHVSEHILNNLTNMAPLVNKQDPMYWSDSMKILMLTRDIYIAGVDFGESSENAHANAGKYFVENIKNLRSDVEPDLIQSEPMDEPLKRKRSLLVS